MFTSPYEGGGDLDRAAGALGGQLGTQARYVQYGPMVFDQNKESLSGKESYEIVVPKEGLLRNDNGYWTVTIYSFADRFLIPNRKELFMILHLTMTKPILMEHTRYVLILKA